jgi:hypothetical protein
MPMWMSRGAALAALVLSLSGAAPAAADTLAERQTAAAALAEQVLQLTQQTDRLMAGMAQTMRSGMEQGIRRNAQLSEAQQSRVIEVMLGEVTLFQSQLLAELRPLMGSFMRDVYAEHFSLAEIRALQAFYTTPAGSKSMTVFLDETPRMMQALLPVMQQRQAHLQERLKAAAERLRSEGINLQN